MGQTYKARGTEVITNGGERVKDNSDFSRRRFLEGLLIGTAGLAFGSKLQAAEILAQNQGRKLGIALLGLGRYATGELGPALRQTKLIELRGVITGHPEKGEKWRRTIVSTKRIFTATRRWTVSPITKTSTSSTS